MTTFVYFLRPKDAEGPVKIGSSCDPYTRLLTYCTWSPIPLEIVARLPGDVDLERRFHAKFADLFSHHEWFRASPELTETIEAIAAGSFDTSALPPPIAIRPPRKRTPEAVEAGKYTRMFGQIVRRGVQPPADVYDASFTYQCQPEEKTRRRAIVRTWVEAHQHVLQKKAA